jgi:DinB superfamily
MPANDLRLDEAVALLRRTPAVLDAWLRGLPSVWTQGREAENTWNAVEIVGHLNHGERTDWIPRARMILEHGPARPFEPFDRSGHAQEVRAKSLDQLLDTFAQLRAESLAALEKLHLERSDLERTGRHPALGQVTLAQLIAAWAVHDLTHLHQISRVMSNQYAAAVGPWSAYLGVLHCQGHSSP